MTRYASDSQSSCISNLSSVQPFPEPCPLQGCLIATKSRKLPVPSKPRRRESNSANPRKPDLSTAFSPPETMPLNPRCMGGRDVLFANYSRATNKRFVLIPTHLRTAMYGRPCLISEPPAITKVYALCPRCSSRKTCARADCVAVCWRWKGCSVRKVTAYIGVRALPCRVVIGSWLLCPRDGVISHYSFSKTLRKTMEGPKSLLSTPVCFGAREG